MKRVGLHFPRWAKLTLYGNLLLSLATGMTWFALHRWGQVEGEFGMEPHPAEPWLLRIHGASAFLILIGFGYLLATHLTVGWRSRRNRPLGLSLVVCLALLAASGYLLYYASGEGFRDTVSWVHFIIGLSFPVILASHVIVGHRRSKK